ncbi:hypothetical protein H0X06_02255 [Candidatus Dependentiae bacterium]|nr:hypothetical protein [Candidatus Dependentiae bacterium]
MKNILALNMLLLAPFCSNAMEHRSDLVENKNEPEVLFTISSDGLKRAVYNKRDYSLRIVNCTDQSETLIGLTDETGIASLMFVADGKIVLLLDSNGTMLSEWSTDGKERSCDPTSPLNRV